MEQKRDEQSRPGLIRRFILPALIILSIIWSMVGESILRQTSEYLITSDSLEQADAIVVLGGIASSRTIAAADLYTEGYAPYIVLTPEEWHSGKTYDILKSLKINNIDSYEFSREVAVKLGVPVEAILVVDSRANSTRTRGQGTEAVYPGKSDQIHHRGLVRHPHYTDGYHLQLDIRWSDPGSYGSDQIRRI
ncbi:MAG: ElyC/SanA/YdcF family protein [Gemmatimonadota bacterium]|nr:ElyC/SanA/YdcF family protein [Gemmatimonadota bacterium]